MPSQERYAWPGVTKADRRHLLRTAVFHNFLDNIGGAEMVGLVLAKDMNAQIFTTNINREKILKMGFTDVEVRSIGRVPLNAPFRQQMALSRFRRLDLKDDFDQYIIAGDWAMAGAVNHKPNLWYVHSPIREIWDLYEFTRNNSVPYIQRPLFDIWVRYNRRLNLKFIDHVDKIACNSTLTKDRVMKYLKRKAVVIYPPIDTGDFRFDDTGDYWLSVNRLIYHKRIEIQMKAFSKMPDERLVIVGCYENSKHFREYAGYLMSIKPPNVTILNFVDRAKLLDLYAGCKGFLTTSKEEDFGLTPVEAMASGKPVIAPNEGGFRETVLDGITGVLIDNIDEKKLMEAVKEIGQDPGSFRFDCISRAKGFDRFVFLKNITEIMAE
jgi:glycosyltransferase involved in cell wall biosynthesis